MIHDSVQITDAHPLHQPLEVLEEEANRSHVPVANSNLHRDLLCLAITTNSCPNLDLFSVNPLF